MSEILKGHGEPDINRTATLGDYYVDVDTESVYKLVDIKYNTVTRGQNFANATSHDGTYEFIWEAVGGNVNMSPYAYICNNNGEYIFESNECTIEEFDPEMVLLTTSRNVVYADVSGGATAIMVGVNIPGNGTIEMIFADPTKDSGHIVLLRRGDGTIGRKLL